MLNKLKPKSEFSRNVLTLMTGSTIAQAIPIAISPILTRIYTPEDFGIFALYMSIASIIAVIATGRYELAIMLPEKDEDAINIVALSAIITVIISLLTLSIVIIFNLQITNLLGNPQISNWLYLVPISVLLTGFYQSFNYWSNRQKQYKTLAQNKVIQSTSTAGVNLSMGLAKWGVVGLIWGNIIGQTLASVILFKNILKKNHNLPTAINKNKIIKMLKRYIKFPKYDIISALANTSAQQITHILFNIIYNPAIAGFFYFTQKILSMPITYISSAILDVFKEQAARDYKKYNNAKKIYKSTFIKLMMIAILPSVFLYFFAVDMFVIVFGEKWQIAGEYAKILSPMLFFRFMGNPLSFMFYIGERQIWDMYSQTLLLCSILLSFFWNTNATQTVYFISLVFSIFYISQIFLSAKIAKIF
ncbi:MAG: translocase [Gammaproteobacteria bacterium]|nr:MAG: translocase [Gammaproteobacteria bacterium]